MAAKTLPSSLKQIMSLVIQLVNFIKSSAVNFKEFSPSCALKRMLNHTSYRCLMVVQRQSIETRA
jgi:hypothetical protein